MKTLVLANQKGGVGKSAVATLLSYHVARQGRRILLIGLLPTTVESTPFQRANFTQVIQQYRPLLIPTDSGVGKFAFIPRPLGGCRSPGRRHCPVGDEKTAARDAWKETEPSISRIGEIVTTEVGRYVAAA